MFFLGNGALSITDQVESNYVLTAKEMLASGDYFSPRIYGEYWYDKPAFFYWELIAAFSLFGTALPRHIREHRCFPDLRVWTAAL